MTMLSDIQRDIARDEELVELRAEVKRLLRVINGDGLSSAIDCLRTRLGLNPARAWLLATLFDLGGETLTIERAMMGMPGYTEDREDRSPGTLTVQICHIRKVLPDPAFIRTLHGTGYRLTREGVDWVGSLVNGRKSTGN